MEVFDLAERAISYRFVRNLKEPLWRAVVTGLIGSHYAHHCATLVLVDAAMPRQAMPVVEAIVALSPGMVVASA